MQRLLQTNADESNTGLTAATSPHFGYDFSQIPLHPPTGIATQEKLSINTPGDEYEEEADRVAEQMMRMPESRLQCACPRSGGGSEYQKAQPVRRPARLLTKRVQAMDMGQITAPPILNEC